jgi:hypothetical protein
VKNNDNIVVVTAWLQTLADQNLWKGVQGTGFQLEEVPQQGRSLHRKMI